MQVASTLWPDIKSQKISEQWFRLKWTKCSPRTQFRQVKTGQPQRGSDKETQDSLPEEVGGGWWPGQADLAYGPHRLNQGMWRLPIGPLGRLHRFSPVAPCYKYKGGQRMRTHTHTHHTSSPLLLILHSLQAQWSLGEVQESSSRQSCSRVLVWVHLQLSLVILGRL